MLDAFRASRECPACLSSMGSLRVRYTNKDAKWYRWVAPTYRCPACQADVVPVTRPIGYVLRALMVVLPLGAGLFVLLRPDFDLMQMLMVVAGPFAFAALLAALASKFGFNYRLTSSAGSRGSGRPEQAGEAR